MKKLLALLLMTAMSTSLLVGCGGDSKEAGSNKETNVTDENDVKQEEEDSEKIKTITYDVTDEETDNIMKFEITEITVFLEISPKSKTEQSQEM